MKLKLENEQYIISMFAILTFDGSIWPKNPGGHTGWGFVIMIPGQPYIRRCGYVGEGAGMSNNVAEYSGLINGMAMAKAVGVKNLAVRGDSQLVINQMGDKKWACGAVNLVPLKAKADYLVKMFERVKFEWNERESNTASDDLSKMGVMMRNTEYYMLLEDHNRMCRIKDGAVVDSHGIAGFDGLNIGAAMFKADSMQINWKLSAEDPIPL